MVVAAKASLYKTKKTIDMNASLVNSIYHL